ncbi:MAG: polysaccharide deacetylase family protein [Patescibacteria group bacterium]
MFKRHSKIFYFIFFLAGVAVFLLLASPSLSSKVKPFFVKPAVEKSADSLEGRETESAEISKIFGAAINTATTTATTHSQARSFSETKTAKKISLELPILIYHHIDKLPQKTAYPGLFNDPAVFEQQLIALKNDGYQTIFLKDLAEALTGKKQLPVKSLALTFDDGYEDFYQQAFPLLKKYDSRATVFVIVDSLNTPGYLTTKQLKEMSASGLVKIGSHTLSHINLKIASDQQIREEIVNSKKKLEKILGQAVDDFAYPYGFFNGRDEQTVREAGYSSAVSTRIGKYQSQNDIFSLRRLRPGNRVASGLLDFLKAF